MCNLGTWPLHTEGMYGLTTRHYLHPDMHCRDRCRYPGSGLDLCEGQDYLVMMTKKTTKTDSTLIAPCGLNCRLCQAYARDKRGCPGCRGDDSLKCKTRVTCRIRNCEKIVIEGSKYCFSCSEFPCERLNRLDSRYRANYGVSVVDNLMEMQKSGVSSFVRKENKKWICSKCGEMLCMHKAQCISCGHTWRDI